MTIAENYPPQVLSCVMNLLGSHDTPRILTALVDDFRGSREEKAARTLSPEDRKTALERLRAAAFLQFTLPGMASIYYGDEAGMEGFDDPFCRRTYPWGREDTALRAYYRSLCRLKKELPALRHGDVRVTAAGEGRIAFSRTAPEQRAKVFVNRSHEVWSLPEGKVRFGRGLDLYGEQTMLQPGGFCLLICQ